MTDTTIDLKRGVDKISPVGTFRYPWLQSPSTKFDAKGLYSVKLALPADDGNTKNFIKQLEDLYQKNLELQAGQSKKKVKGADKPWGEELDKDDTPTGNIVFNCKANAKRGDFDFRPKIFNADGTPYTTGVPIGGGTQGALALRVRGWLMQAKNEAGITLQLEAALLHKVVPAGKNTAEQFGFTLSEVAEATEKEEY